MPETKNKETTPKQMVLIVLITIVLLLLVVQTVSFGSESRTELPTDRDTCLHSGYIWSQSAERCYDTGAVEVPDSSISNQLSVGYLVIDA